MVRECISSSFSATRLGNWERGSEGVAGRSQLNPVGGYCEHSFEDLEALRPKPAQGLRPHYLPSQSTKPVRGKAPNPTPRDSHREWHCDSERKSLPRRQRPVPNRGTITNKMGTFGPADVRRTQGFGEWAPPAVCVVSWDPFQHSKAEVPTWATHKNQGLRKEFQRQRLVGDHLTSGTVSHGRRQSDTATRRRSKSALGGKTTDSRLSVGGGRLSADPVERESVELISADRLIATPSGIGTQCRIDQSSVPVPDFAAHKLSPRQRSPTNSTLEPIAAPDGFKFASHVRPTTTSSAATSKSPKSNSDRLDELMEEMIAENELKIVDLQTRIDSTVARATVPWPWADADSVATAIGPRY